MEILQVSGHPHPLKLIDLQHEDQRYEEEEEDVDDDDDGGHGDPITKERFHGVICNRCGQEINIYHRYYYKCMIDSSCLFSLHKFCAELPISLKHPSHPKHTLVMVTNCDLICKICKRDQKPIQMSYRCRECYYSIDVKCAVEVGKNIIYHPCHPHLLTCTIYQPILCDCKACGKRHEGIFYQCTICVGFTIHKDCAFLPKTLLIQQTTNDAFYHTHPLTISYSFPRKDQEAKYDPRCRVCGHSFYGTEDLWIYKCDKCLYYVHVDCATSTREPFMSIFLPPGLGKTIKNFEDVDHPRLLHLPFLDESYSIPKHLFFQETETGDHMIYLKHKHPLVLVDQAQTSSKIGSSVLVCHNPMKKIQLLCNGCLRPIMSTMPFYKCAEGCDFLLHEWCTRLPTEIENHPDHPQHTLLLMYSESLPVSFGVFHCDACFLPCNGYAYCCFKCEYYVDVSCGLIPKEITHKAHPNHILSIDRKRGSCHMCKKSHRFLHEYPLLRWFSKEEKILFYCCNACDIYIHPECALLLTETIRHKHDKHPMNLSYLPIENYKSEYFCEMCENELNPHESFYHCQECFQSAHSACAPLLPQCEIDITPLKRSVYYFVNIKFGGIRKSEAHPHPLSFALGIVSDGRCSRCLGKSECTMIFKCVECKFAIHYMCCW